MPINNHSISFPFAHCDMQMLVAYNAAGDPQYVGRARPSAATSAAEWQITEIGYDASRNVTSLKFAGGTNEYSKVWDDRATYTYA